MNKDKMPERAHLWQMTSLTFVRWLCPIHFKKSWFSEVRVSALATELGNRKGREGGQKEQVVASPTPERCVLDAAQSVARATSRVKNSSSVKRDS